MTDVVETKRAKPRSQSNRRLRAMGSRASVTLMAAGICGIFILPLIYMAVAAFDNSNTLSTPGAPLYPAVNRSISCPDSSVCTFTTGYVDINNLRFNKAPVPGSTVATVAASTANAYANSTVTVTTRGKISFAVVDPSATTPVLFQSREGANKPQLLVETCSAAQDTQKPVAPTGLKATTKSYGEIDLSWTASASPDVAVYKVYRDGSTLATVGSTSWFDTTVVAASDHSYTISAVDGAGNESDQTDAVKATAGPVPSKASTPDETKPTAPTALKATPTAPTTVELSWTAATDNVAVVSYGIHRDGSIIAQVAGDVTKFTDRTTVGGTKYAYSVTAADAATYISDPSNEISVTTTADNSCVKSTTSFDAVADSYTDQSKPDTNFGSEQVLKTSNAAGAKQVAYVMFDTTKLPDGTITSATLKLYSTTASTSGYTVAAVTGTWGELQWVVDKTIDSTGVALPIYIVPGHGNLALLAARNLNTLQPSVFIDPTNNKQVQMIVNVGSLERVWDFHISMENFGTAAGWADSVTSGAVTDSSLGGNFGGFARFFFNTLIIAVLGTIGATVSAVIVAFGFARFKFPGRDLLFMVLIGTILLPFQVTLIPQFIIFQAIGWTGTWLPLIVPHYFSNAYNVFLLRQYFLTLPRELDEAAMMDGATPIRILRSVIIPQSWPAIMSVVLFHFFFAWNDFLAPLIYLSGKADLFPIAIGLNLFNTTFRTANAPAAIQAGALMSLILPVIIFFIAQKVFMRGVVISGVEK